MIQIINIVFSEKSIIQKEDTGLNKGKVALEKKVKILINVASLIRK